MELPKYPPKYPVYIISKGRWDHALRMTQRTMEELKIPYRIVIEKDEYDQYSKVVPKEKILGPFDYFPYKFRTLFILDQSRLECKGLLGARLQAAMHTDRAAGIPNLIQLQLKILH